jgi:hypothetical protein
LPAGLCESAALAKSVSLAVAALTGGARTALLVQGVGAAARDVGEHA